MKERPCAYQSSEYSDPDTLIELGHDVEKPYGLLFLRISTIREGKQNEIHHPMTKLYFWLCQ